MPLPIVNAFLEQLTDKERCAYQIAKTQLGSSFNLEKSIGFQKWIKAKKKPHSI